MWARSSARQLELGAPDDHLAAVLDEIASICLRFNLGRF
jgi:hypothetical protein